MAHREPRAVNIVSITLFCFLASVIYGAWKYIPVYWERDKIKETISSALMSAHRLNDDQLGEEIRNNMVRKHNMTDIQSEDVEVYRSHGFIEAKVFYSVEVQHLFGKVHSFVLSSEVKRRIIHL